jgi:hypothetical protein
LGRNIERLVYGNGTELTMMVEQQLPMTTTQLAGHGISAVTGRLTPAALGVLMLNLIGIGAAVYFLNVLIVGQQTHLKNLLDVQQNQITQVLRTHDREFDALMAMVREASKPPPEPPLPSLVPPEPEPKPRR